MLSDELFQSFVVPLQQISISNNCRRVSRSHLDSLRTLSHTSFTSRRHRLKKRLKTRRNRGRKLLSGFLFLFKPTQRFTCLSFIYLIYFVFVWSRLWAWCVFNLPQRPAFGPLSGSGTCRWIRSVGDSSSQTNSPAQRHQSPRHELLWLNVWGQTGPLTIGWIQKTASDRRSDVRKKKADRSAELRRRFFRDVIRGKKALGGGERACDRHSRSIKARCSQRNAGMSRLPWLTGVFAYILPTVCWHVCSSFLISNADVRVRDSTVFQTSVIAV